MAQRTAELETSNKALARADDQRTRLELEFLRDILEGIPDGICVYNGDDKLVLFNEEFRTGILSGLADVIRPGIHFSDLVRTAIERDLVDIPDGDVDAYMRSRLEHHRRGTEGREVKMANDRWMLTRERRMANGWSIGVRSDITARKQLEEQLRQSHKMEAVGMLAGGIAHDFNNLLTVINGNAELALATLGSEHPESRDLEQILQAGGRAASLTRQLLAFSRQQMLEPRVLDLNDVVADVEKLLVRTIGENLELVLKLAPQLDPVKVDRTQMEQVLLNLAVNARDAMPAGGCLTLATTNIELGTTVPRDRSFPTEPGAYVMLTVSDTGAGMNEETRQRVFDPFFTTKPRDKGTGLGLSTVYGIVKQSGGYIWVESELDQGTTFHICLPRTEEAVETTEETRRVPDSEGGVAETILLVEDEEVVREFLAEVLQQKGYRVLVAQHPQEALEICEGFTDPIDLLVTDIVMPGSTGQKLAMEILALRPKMRVLYMSGYPEFQWKDRSDSASAFLAKPFSPGEMTRRVREVLESA